VNRRKQRPGKGKGKGRQDGGIPTDDAIQARLKRSETGPLTAVELQEALKVGAEHSEPFVVRLEAMVAKGRVYRVKGDRYAAPGKINLSVGRLTVTRAGDGFVIPDEAPKGKGDVFVPSRSLGSAMDGDHVVVRVERRRRGRAPSGTIIKVLERARSVIVGTFRAGRRFGVVVPQDPKLLRDIFIPSGDELIPAESDVVVVRITSWGDEKRNPIGEIEKILGAFGAPGVDILSVIHGHGLPTEFTPGVEEEAKRIAAEAGTATDAGRVDRRDLNAFTIDPADAKDHDDALSIRDLGGDRWEVGVHIADVSRFVEPGGVIDLDAIERATSVYLVDRVLPMLPHALSSDACSLRPDEDRKTISLFVTLDGSGRRSDTRIERALIRSRHRISYPKAQAVLDGGLTISEETDRDIHALHRLDMVLRGIRAKRGSLDFDMPEARVLIGPSGEATDIQKTERLDAHRLVESFMLLANEVVAEMGVEKHLPVLYRIHEPPAKTRLEDLRKFLATLGHPLPRGVPHATDLQKVLAEVRGSAEEGLVSTLILRTMSRARYDPENLGHYGLSTEFYLHFTSPIRRYPDLVVHRALVDMISGERPRKDPDLVELAAHTSGRERRADGAARETIALKKVEYMERHLGDEFDGTVSGVAAFGFFVLLDAVFVDGLVHISSLGDDYYVFREAEYALVGERRHRRFRLGDRVRIKVARVNKTERKIDFVLMDTPADEADGTH